MKFLKGESFDFEQRNSRGRTPLLDQSYWPGASCLATLPLLLEYGADVHATDNEGNSALHLAMLSNFTTIGEHSGHLKQKLALLVEAGVDLHHRNMKGLTPSYLARFRCDCWDEWCAALRRNGVDVNEVAEAESDLWCLTDDDDDNDVEDGDESPRRIRWPFVW